jgi:hypothetical protein
MHSRRLALQEKYIESLEIIIKAMLLRDWKAAEGNDFGFS